MQRRSQYLDNVLCDNVDEKKQIFPTTTASTQCKKQHVPLYSIQAVTQSGKLLSQISINLCLVIILMTCVLKDMRSKLINVTRQVINT